MDHAALAPRAHPRCFVCHPNVPGGLHLEFRRETDGAVTAECRLASCYQGYPGLLHGGLIATLLDGAMTNCLFLHQIEALTAELAVRYRHPVRLDQPVVLRAWIHEQRLPLARLRAELWQQQKLHATAQGVFMQIRKPA